MDLRKRYLTPLLRYIHIVLYKTYANLKGEHDKTYLGPIWWAVEPLIATAVFYILFTHLIPGFGGGGRRASMMSMAGTHPVAFLYIGMVIYGWFSGGINAGANSVVSHAGLMQQIRLPLLIFPFITISNLSWKFLFSLLVLFPLLWLQHCPVTFTYFALPALLVIQYFIIIAMSLPFAAVVPFFQDARTVLGTFLSLFMWLSGVFQDGSHISPRWRPLYYSNPAAALIEAYRNVLIEGRWPHWMILFRACGIPLIFFLAGFLILRKIERKVTKIPL